MMDFSAFLQLLYRQKLTIGIITIATIIAALVVAVLQIPTYTTTLLYSTGIGNATASEQSFDVTKSADDFANTVIGWLRSPDFANTLSELAATPVNLSGENQAKQNFLITLTYEEAEAGDRIVDLFGKRLEEEIAKYNRNSKIQYFATLHGESQSENQLNSIQIGEAAAVGGVLLGIVWVLLCITFGNRVSSVEEAEKLLKVKTAVRFCCWKNGEIEFLEALLKKVGNNALLVGVDISVDKLAEKLKTKHKTAKLPNEASLLVKTDAKPILVVRLDKTKIGSLRQIRALAEKEIHLAIWG